MINPDAAQTNFNSVPVTVKAILFDGGNSRLLVSQEGTSDELVVMLPQTRQFDHIQAGDRIRVGWDAAVSLCFLKSDWKLYDEK